MRYLLTAVSLALVLAACGKEPQESSEARSSAPGAASVTATAGSKKACVSGEGFNRLPADVCLSTPYRFVGVRSYKDGQARDRLRVTFRAEGTSDLVVRDVSDAFSAAGYYVRPREEANDGSIHVPMTKKDKATTYLVVKQIASSPQQAESTEFFVDFLASAAESTSAH